MTLTLSFGLLAIVHIFHNCFNRVAFFILFCGHPVIPSRSHLLELLVYAGYCILLYCSVPWGEDLSFVGRCTGRCRMTMKCSTGSTVTHVSSRLRRATRRPTDLCRLNTTTLKSATESNVSAPLKVANFVSLLPQWLCLSDIFQCGQWFRKEPHYVPQSAKVCLSS